MFPRSDERGPIEAAAAEYGPRSDDCCPIEAWWSP